MIRLTGGRFRGRSIATPRHVSTRPTQAKLRQALFNSLQTLIPDARVLDLFAGSGSLGFEALSRDCAHVTFVENDRGAVKLIQASARDLGVEGELRISSEDLDEMARDLPRLAEAGLFDVVLADPPYAGGWEKRLLEEVDWERVLAPGGRLCIEWGAQKSLDYREGELPERVGCLVKVREKSYGDSVLTTFERSPP